MQYPIALHGHVKTKRLGVGKGGRGNVLNLQKNRSQQDPADSDNGVNAEASIWSDNPAWFAGINEGDEIVVLGLWKVSRGKPTPVDTAGRYKTFTTNKLSVNLVVMEQIAKVPVR